jgi:hypothetical protein
MSNNNKWTRVEFEPGSLTQEAKERRTKAEKETRRDIQKPIQQLICDVHEGSLDPNESTDKRLLYMSSRMVSMMGRVALEHERASRRLVWLTWVLVFLTILLSIETVAMVYFEIFHSHAG